MGLKLQTLGKSRDSRGCPTFLSVLTGGGSEGLSARQSAHCSRTADVTQPQLQRGSKHSPSLALAYLNLRRMEQVGTCSPAAQPDALELIQCLRFVSIAVFIWKMVHTGTACSC